MGLLWLLAINAELEDEAALFVVELVAVGLGSTDLLVCLYFGGELDFDFGIFGEAEAEADEERAGVAAGDTVDCERASIFSVLCFWRYLCGLYRAVGVGAGGERRDVCVAVLAGSGLPLGDGRWRGKDGKLGVD